MELVEFKMQIQDIPSIETFSATAHIESNSMCGQNLINPSLLHYLNYRRKTKKPQVEDPVGEFTCVACGRFVDFCECLGDYY